METMNPRKQAYGRKAEILVRYLLERNGRTVEQKEYNSRFDLLVDGKWRCEVKVAQPRALDKGRRQIFGWTVNFHRHGELKEDCDFYIIRLEQVPGFKAAVHLVLRSPVGRKTMQFTLRGLMETGAPMIADFRTVCSGEWSDKEEQ